MENSPRTVEALVLIGLLDRNYAVEFLTKECVYPQFDEAQAFETWEKYRSYMNEMPIREVSAPARLALNGDEQKAAEAFLRQYRRPNILDVVKVDPRRCVVWQHQIITQISEIHSRNMLTPDALARESLRAPTSSISAQIVSMPNDIRVPVPHAEFIFSHRNPEGFQVQQLPQPIAVTALNDRLLLFSGYHRSVGIMTDTYADGNARSLLAVLTTDGDKVFPPGSPSQNIMDIVRGVRPLFLEDFLDDRFAMKVSVRKKRCELWIQAKIMWLDEE